MVKASISLRAQVLGVMAVSFGTVLLCSVVFFHSYASRKAAKRLESLGAKMQASAQLQANQILPALLISEQTDALDVQLSRIREQEGLSEARFEKRFEKTDCSRGPGNTSICVEAENHAVTTSTPVVFDGRTYGFLVKARKVDAEEGEARSNEPIFGIVITLSLSFLIFALWVSYFLDRHVRKALLSLESRLEPILAETAKEIPSDYRVKEINAVVDQVRRLVSKFQNHKAQAAVGVFAAQVAHDIRSPLAALSMAEKDLSTLPEDTRIMIRGSIGRIRDIANHLLEKNNSFSVKGSVEEAGHHLLSDLLESLITEKRMQFRSKLNLEIETRLDPSSYGLFAVVQPTEFQRVLSNLINNAVEAIPGAGKVTVSLQSIGAQIEVAVQDAGKGIPAAVLPRLMHRGETYGKEGGSGLGLYHARKSCESWGGELRVLSEADKGTTVTIRLPRVKAPEWFLAGLTLAPFSKILVLDDDQSIHQVWQGRVDSSLPKEAGIEIVHLSTPDELRAWCRSSGAAHVACQYLVDYELLGFPESGLDLIEELGLGERSVLVTSHYEEALVRDRCLRLKVPMIPKGMAGFVPMRVQRS